MPPAADFAGGNALDAAALPPLFEVVSVEGLSVSTPTLAFGHCDDVVEQNAWVSVESTALLALVSMGQPEGTPNLPDGVVFLIRHREPMANLFGHGESAAFAGGDTSVAGPSLALTFAVSGEQKVALQANRRVVVDQNPQHFPFPTHWLGTLLLLPCCCFPT